jgi:hypothetical protein
LTITGCPNLTSLGLQARLYNIQTLVLENLPLLAPSSLSDITKALPYGGMPGLKQFTIKKCPLMNDDTCIDIARMINQGLAQLVMEGLPLVTFKGINHIKKNIWHNVGKLEIQTVSMRDPRIQGNEYPKFRRSYFNLLAYVDANVQRMPTWKLLPGNDDQMPGKRAELTESDYQKPPADSSESDYESDSKMPPGKNLSDSDGELDVDY